eukprot:TRINITY_DN4574_c0_g1_i1.p1 TRINITY_DN4574_c0_g1~~TRINITY_DN4574_c0_g1_i1.p1  ORF type:complete len:355 (-),score=53.82 TRINITY_DN4574_c0_g1_i1:131-1195(-)
MGSCESAEEKEATKLSRDIDRTLKHDNRKVIQRRIDLLLLGSPGSGTGLLRRQIKLLYCDGWTDDEKATLRKVIHSKLFVWMHNFVEACRGFGIEIKDAKSREIAEEFERMDLSKTTDLVLDDEMASKIERLWGDSSIIEAYDRWAQLNPSETAEVSHFFYSIHRLVGDFLVTEEDCIMANVRSTRVEDQEFGFVNSHLRLVDGTGCRGRPKKWMHCFQNVLAVVFFVALAEFDLPLPEDPCVFRLWKELKNFKTMADCEGFAKCAIIVILNQKDIFEEKLRTGASLQKVFPEYQGSTAEDAINFVRDKFVSQSTSGRDIYTNYTNARSVEYVKLIFAAVQNVLLGARFEDDGF